MRKGKKNYLVIALIVILLSLAIGYATFAQTLNITGTAKSVGKWDIQFADQKMYLTSDGEKTPISTENVNEVALSDENHKMTVKVKLEKPGDSKTVDFKVVNGGSIDAKLTSFTIKAVNGTDMTSASTVSAAGGVYTNDSGTIKMTLNNTNVAENTTLKAKDDNSTDDELSYQMVFEWPGTATSSTEVDDTATFAITFEYVQM